MKSLNALADPNTDNEIADPKLAAILAAAKTTFLAHGYDLTSMDQIAMTASVSKRTVYSRFSSKEELFGAAIEYSCKDLLPTSLPELTSNLPIRELIEKLSINFLRGALRPDALALRRIATFEAGRNPEIGRVFLKHGPGWLIDQFTPIFIEIGSAAGLKTDDPHQTLWRMGSLISEPLHNRMLLGDTPDDLETAILEQVEFGLAAFFYIFGTQDT